MAYTSALLRPIYAGLIAGLTTGLISCVPTADKPSKMIGTWQGKDPGDQSNIGMQISFNNGRYTVNANDDKTTPDWCGVSATASATGSLIPSQELPVNLLWVCDNANKNQPIIPNHNQLQLKQRHH